MLRSAVVSASYRSGDRLTDERTGEEKFYRKDVQPDTIILAPSTSPKWVQDRNCLWNEVEKSETRVNLVWLEKLMGNRITKDRAEQDISRAKGEIKFHDENLNYHREKLGFSNENEFNQVINQHETNRPGLLEKNRNTRQYIRSERDMLQKAENAHKNAFVRQVASLLLCILNVLKCVI
jgi:hypothetical protein